jgi:hypothetical protein
MNGEIKMEIINNIISKFNKIINKINNPVEVDPRRFNDPVAMITEWSPLPNARGANFCTGRLVQTDELVIKFRPTPGVIIFFSAFVLVSVAFPLIFMRPPFRGSKFLVIIPILFMAVGLYGLFKFTRPVVFDKRSGLFYKGRRKTDLNDSKKQNKRCILLDDIYAIQLLSSFVSSQDSDGMDHSYYSYELNLVMNDGDRINVLSHGNLLNIRTDAQTLSRFLNVKLWDTIRDGSY